MRELISFRTSEANKIKLIEKAEERDISVSEIMNFLLIKYIKGNFMTDDNYYLVLNALDRATDLLQSFHRMNEICERIMSKKDLHNSQTDINELLQMITSLKHKVKESG